MELKILLDTNAIIALLQNNEALHHIASKSSEVYISIISELEFKAFSNISPNDINLFNEFVNRISVIDLNHDDQAMQDKIIEIRKNHKLKLPDAIIAASAIMVNSSLISADKEFIKIKELKLIDWNRI